jgi:hypothetical protein
MWRLTAEERLPAPAGENVPAGVKTNAEMFAAITCGCVRMSHKYSIIMVSALKKIILSSGCGFEC